MELIILVCLTVALVVLLPVIGYVSLRYAKTNPHRPPHVEGANGFVKAQGENLYDGKGDLLLLKGVNFGNWFVQEFWMNVSAVGAFETGIYTQSRGARAMKENPNLTPAQIEELQALYLETYIKESDFQTVASLGFNTVRIPFTYRNLTKEDGATLKEDAFRYLDWAVDCCKKYGLYAVLDLHGAIGSQNCDHHSGDDAHFDLYGNRAYMDATIGLWKAIAAHYKDEPAVAAYDLINEPRRAKGRFCGRKQFDFYDELYRAIREIDENHLIMAECFTFPTHGVSPKVYGWENVCYEYHIYNLTPFSQKTCLGFYKALHNFKDYRVPVYIGEWNAWQNDKDWEASTAFFEEQGWSYSSWTYKTNAYFYSRSKKHHNSWGLFELDIPPVDLSGATFEEIARVYASVGTEHAKKTHVYEFYRRCLKENENKKSNKEK